MRQAKHVHIQTEHRALRGEQKMGTDTSHLPSWWGDTYHSTLGTSPGFIGLYISARGKARDTHVVGSFHAFL